MTAPSAEDNAELQALQSRLAAAQADLQILRRRIADLTTADHIVRDLRRENDALSRRAVSLEGELAAIRASTSWRLTGPVRAAAVFLHHLREGVSAWALQKPRSLPRRWVDAIRSGPGMSGEDPLIYYWIDSTATFPGNTGIQRVVRQLARGLIEAGHKLVPVKRGGAGRPFGQPSDDDLAHLARWNGPSIDGWAPWTPPAERRGRGWFLIAELPLNLSEPDQRLLRDTAKAAGLKTAAIFHDAIPWSMRDTYPEIFAAAHRDYMADLADYDLILPNSKYSRSELMSVLAEEFARPRSAMGHIVACPLAGEFPQTLATSASRAEGDGTVRILSVGSVEPRKNHERLLEAFARACEQSPARLHLTIVGGAHGHDPELVKRVRERVNDNPRVDWEDQADDARIQALYETCDFSIYPSVKEGFGMPILEALSYGLPVICANFGAMDEVASGGGGCLTVDVTDVQAIADAICVLANDPDRRRALAAAAKLRTSRSWLDYARDVAAHMNLWTPPDPA